MSELLRIYAPDECGADGYPPEWHGRIAGLDLRVTPIKDVVRAQAGHRCERCGHPYPPDIAETCLRGEWTPCDTACTHGGPTRTDSDDYPGTGGPRTWVEAQWRILTVHHLNGIKWDCRWWNLAALCQRCHLSVQGRVVMERVWVWEHTEWFKPHAAAWYAWDYLGEELTREETMERLEELLELERVSEIGPC